MANQAKRQTVPTRTTTYPIFRKLLHGFDGDAMAAFYDTETRKVTFLELA
ncbi:MAG: hypothetical protein ACNA78_11465 [Balneolaceae bacterium]